MTKVTQVMSKHTMSVIPIHPSDALTSQAPGMQTHLTEMKNTYLISISIYVIQRANAPARSIKTNGFIRGRKILLSPGIIPHTLRVKQTKVVFISRAHVTLMKI